MAAALVGWLVPTMGWVAATGTLPAPLAGPVAQWLPSLPTMASATVLYLGGMVVLALSAYALVGLRHMRRSRRRA